ncbi:MAG: membrane protein [Brockia lithotrophica]|uniref:Membrane protein n=1 Tax=Brockia lithotrophica TaxID=933949 RepID=A0A2T5G5K9_9BACL|nr:MAG: membrane protein [Brockia lithotrophica]
MTSDRTLPPRTEDLATRDFPSAEKVSAHAGTEEDELPASEPSGLRKVVFHDVLPGIIVVLASLLMAFSYNAFLIPHKILSGGVAGVAMILSLFTPVSAGTYLFLLNVPLFVFGYFTLGRRFIRESALSVATLAVAMNFIPVRPLSNDPVISSVFGGALVGLGMGVIYRMAGSSGGIDIVAFYLARRRDFPMGTLLFSFNAAVVALAGVLLSPERALYTMLGMYVSSRVVDGVFTRHLKLTLFIVTQKGEAVRRALLELNRGVTILEGIGAYSGKKRSVLMTVVTRYELPLLKRKLLRIDPYAFVDAVQSVDVVGGFQHREPLEEEEPIYLLLSPPEEERSAAKSLVRTSNGTTRRLFVKKKGVSPPPPQKT